METETTEFIPQVSDNLTTDSDRVKALVVGAGPTDSGGGQSHTIENPFKKKGRVGHSPIRIRTGSLGSVDLTTDAEYMQTPSTGTPPKENPDEELGKRTSKRKEISPTTKGNDNKDIGEILNELKVGNQKLIAITKDVRNTKQEIKNIISQQARLITKAISKYESWEQETQTSKGAGTGVKKHKTEEETKAKERRTVGIQTDPVDLQKDMADAKMKMQKEISDTLENKRDYTSFTKILDCEWQPISFRITSLEVGNWGNMDPQDSMALLIDAKAKPSDKSMKPLITKYPMVTSILEEGIIEGNLEYISAQTELKASRPNMSKTHNNTIFLLPINLDNDVFDDVETLFRLLEKVRDEALKKNIKTLNVTTLGEFNEDYIRKSAEYIFRDALEAVTIIRANGTNKKESAEGKRKPKEAIEKIIVKAQGQTYADLLKSVKKGVDITKAGVTVKTIKKTRGGDLLFEIPGKENAARFCEQIKNNTKDKEVIVSPSGEIIHITDIDAEIGEEILLEEIQKNKEGLQVEDIEIMSLRTGRDGNQAAIVRLQKRAAEHFLEKGRIKIGWVLCRVSRRVKITRCFRCLQYGHRSNDCDGTDRKGVCYKCGKQGHLAKECSQGPYCITCEKGGHWTGQMSCPHFRKLVNEKRKASTRRNTRIGSELHKNEAKAEANQQ